MDPLFRAPALGDVAKAPDSPHRPPGDILRARITLEDAPVLEFDRVEALGLGMRVQLLHLGDEGGGVLDLIEYKTQRAIVVPRFDDLRRNAPHVDEALVEAGDAAVLRHHQDAVGGRLEGGAKKGNRGPQFLVDSLARGDILPYAPASPELAAGVDHRLAVDGQVALHAARIQARAFEAAERLVAVPDH